MNPTQPRLLPDFAAVPTPSERRGARRYWQTAQESLDLFSTASTPPACHCCASTEHETADCPHGSAPDLFSVEPAYEYATAAECGADLTQSAGSVTRTWVLTGSTKCDMCPGDLLDEHHWREVDGVTGKPIEWHAPDMFAASHIAAMGPRRVTR